LKEKSLNGTAKNFEVVPQNIKTYKRLDSCCSKQRHDELSDAQEIGLQIRNKELFIQKSEALCFVYKHYHLSSRDVYHRKRNKKHITESSRKFFLLDITKIYNKAKKYCFEKVYYDTKSKSIALSTILHH
jgi:hypothetical protein